MFSALEDMSRIFHLFFFYGKNVKYCKKGSFLSKITNIWPLTVRVKQVAGKTVFLAQLLQKENHVNFVAPKKRLIYRE